MKRLFAAWLALLALTAPAWADGTINTLTAGGALAGSELIPMFQTANPAVSTTPLALATYFDSLTATLTNKSIDSGSNTLTGVGLLGSGNSWSTGGNTIPICSLSGTSVTPNGANCAIYTLTLSGNTTINFPTGLPSSSAAYQQKLFDIQQPASGGPYGVTFATGTGYYFPQAGAQPVLTTTPSAYDEISCGIFGGGSPIAKCSNNGLTNFQATALITLDSNHVAGTAAAGACGTPCTQTVNVTGSTAGHFRVVAVFACNNSGCTAAAGTAPATVTTSTSDVCTMASGAFINGNQGSNVQGSIWFCPTIHSGNPTITATWAANGSVFYASVAAAEFGAPVWFSQADAGIGGTSNGGPATNISVSTAAATARNGELVYSWCNGSGGSLSAGNGTLINLGGTTSIMQYLLSPITQVQTITSTQASGNYNCAIAGFQ